MQDLFSRHPGLIYASAHDYNLQLLEYEEGFQLISGSISHTESTGHEAGTLFASSERGYIRLEYLNSGEIRIGFHEAGPETPREGPVQYPRSAFNVFRQQYSGYLTEGLLYTDVTFAGGRYYIDKQDGVQPGAENDVDFVSGEVRVTSPVGAMVRRRTSLPSSDGSRRSARL